MIDYLSLMLLYTPSRVFGVAVVAGVVAATLGWIRVAGRVADAWTHVAARATTRREHVYRGPLRTASIERVPLLVVVTALTSFALYPGLAGWLLVFASELHGHFGFAAVALGLLGLGVAMACCTHLVVTRGAAASLLWRRRIQVAAVGGLVAHGAILVGLAAVMMGLFDSASIELRGIKDTTATMTLGEIRDILPERPIFLFAGGHSVVTWFTVGCGAFTHASASLVHAALLLALARRANHDSAEAAASPE